jgi:hypothetical protein
MVVVWVVIELFSELLSMGDDDPLEVSVEVCIGSSLVVSTSGIFPSSGLSPQS